MTDASVPQCIGLILDGNRRWAREHGLPTLEGHRRGLDKIKDIARWAKKAGVGTVIVYAFSTENWNRSPEEVAYLMKLFAEMLSGELDDVKKDGGKIRFIGQRERFEKRLQEEMNRVEAETQEATGGTLVVALSYGGRAEILAAVNKLLKTGTVEIDEDGFRKTLWSADIPDPDLIVRTGKEKRLSNFLTWQSAYSELFFTDTYLPDFSEEEFNAILIEYATRERRHGK